MSYAGNAITNDYSGRYYKFEWTSTQNIATNKTTVNWKLSAEGGSAEWYAERTLKVTIDGSAIVSKTDRVERYAGEISSGSFTLTHDSSGNRTFTVDIQAAVYVTTVNLTRTKTFTLDTIPRAATLTSAPNFTSTDNPKIVYSNPAGSSVSSLQACISLDGTKDDISYRSLSKTGTEYTFNLTTAERNTLLNATSGNSRSVTFIVKTVISGTSYTSKLVKTFSVASSASAPSITGTVYDTNSTTTALTGDSSKLIKGYSNAYFSVGASATTGASISSVSCTSGGNKLTTSTGTFNGVTSGSFYFTAKDSRGNSASKTVEKTVIDYFKPTVNMRHYLDTEGNLSIEVSGTFFNSSFGAVSNTLTLALAIWELEEESKPPIIPTVTATISGNNFSYSTEKTGLDYKKRYGVYLAARDKLGAASIDTSTTSEPVFDWGKEDFNFNVPINMEGSTILRKSDKNMVLAASGGRVYIRPNGDTDTMGETYIDSAGNLAAIGNISGANVSASGNITATGYVNAGSNIYSAANVTAEGYLWSKGNTYCYGILECSGDANISGTTSTSALTINGRNHGYMTRLHTDNGRFMNGSQSVTLSGTSGINWQHTGYILIWMLYKDGNVYANNSNYTFIPRAACNFNNGIITLPLIAEDGTTSGAKTLYVTDDGSTTTIKGKDSNGSAPNNGWVLRYIYGF